MSAAALITRTTKRTRRGPLTFSRCSPSSPAPAWTLREDTCPSTRRWPRTFRSSSTEWNRPGAAPAVLQHDAFVNYDGFRFRHTRQYDAVNGPKHKNNRRRKVYYDRGQMGGKNRETRVSFLRALFIRFEKTPGTFGRIIERPFEFVPNLTAAVVENVFYRRPSRPFRFSGPFAPTRFPRLPA